MIKDVCILGGGTAGFMTAAVLSKLNLNVKCIYSSKIGTIGVGESTQLEINEIFSFLGLKDEDWMKKCNATYKSNIGFDSWSNPGEKFFYPFEEGKSDKDTVNNFFELCALFPDEVDHLQFARFVTPSSRFAELNRLIKDGWEFDRNTAYHFDTKLLSEVFYEYCVKNGVEFIDDTYITSVHGDDGIDHIICEESGGHHADLFVDCSGFKSLLLGEEMQVPFDPYDSMINDRVLSCKIPYTNKEEQLKNYTNNVAMDNGWCWEIPLWDGLSLGYVHTLKFANEKDIFDEFYKFVKEKHGMDPGEIKITSFKSGRRRTAWVKNVASVGLSFGFIEPLEATGLFSVVTNIFRLMEVITKSKQINSFDRKLFNTVVETQLDVQKTFVDMHYLAAHKCDTKYWKHVTNEIEHDWTKSNHTLAIGMTITARDYANNYYGGLPCILAGNGYSPLSPGFVRGIRNDKTILESIKDAWLEKDKKYNDIINRCPTTYEFLLETIYKD